MAGDFVDRSPHCPLAVELGLDHKPHSPFYWQIERSIPNQLCSQLVIIYRWKYHHAFWFYDFRSIDALFGDSVASQFCMAWLARGLDQSVHLVAGLAHRSALELGG